MGDDYIHSENQLEQALSLNKILIEALNQERADRRVTRRVSIICACVCVASLLLFAGVLGVLAAGINIETTTTTEESTVEQDTGGGSGDAVYQAGEGANYYAGGEP